MTHTDDAAQTQSPRPLGSLAGHLRLSVIVFLVCAAGVLLHEIVSLWFFTSVSSGALSDPVQIGDIGLLIDLIGLVAIIYLLVFIWSIVMVCRWTFRAMKNLRLRGEETDTSPTMAVVWYFIPFANLWMPFAATQDIWRRSMDPSGQNAPPVPFAMGAWWGLWVFGNIVASIGNQFIGFLDTNVSLDQLAIGTGFHIVSSIMLIASAYFLLRWVPVISKAQDDFALQKVFE